MEGGGGKKRKVLVKDKVVGEEGGNLVYSETTWKFFSVTLFGSEHGTESIGHSKLSCVKKTPTRLPVFGTQVEFDRYDLLLCPHKVQ